MIALNLDKDILYNLYVIKKKNMYAISKELNCDHNTVKYYLNKYDIKLNKKFTLNKEKLYSLYINKKHSSIEISKILNCSESSVLKYLKIYGIKVRNNLEAHKNISTETLKRMSIAHKGKPSGRLGKRASLESRINSSIAHGGTGKLEVQKYPVAFNRILKKEIKIRDNYTCQICNKSGGLLVIHHIDYDKQNSNKDNLVTLHNTCHGYTNKDRNLWKEFFKNNIISINI